MKSLSLLLFLGLSVSCGSDGGGDKKDQDPQQSCPNGAATCDQPAPGGDPTPDPTPKPTPTATPGPKPTTKPVPKPTETPIPPLPGKTYVTCRGDEILRGLDADGKAICDKASATLPYAMAADQDNLKAELVELVDELQDCGFSLVLGSHCEDSKFNISRQQAFAGSDGRFVFYLILSDNNNQNWLVGIVYATETKDGSISRYSDAKEIIIMANPASSLSSYVQELYNTGDKSLSTSLRLASKDERLQRLESAADFRRYTFAVRQFLKTERGRVEASLEDNKVLIRDTGYDIYQYDLLRLLFENSSEPVKGLMQEWTAAWINRQHATLQALSSIIQAQGAASLSAPVLKGLRYAIGSLDELLIINGVQALLPHISVKDHEDVLSLIRLLKNLTAKIRLLAFDALVSLIHDADTLAGYEKDLGAVVGSYGDEEASRLLAKTLTPASTRELCNLGLPNLDRDIRKIAFDALRERNLKGFEALLRKAITGYGGQEAVSLLAGTVSQDSTEALVVDALKNLDRDLRNIAFSALQNRVAGLAGFENKLAAAIGSYGELEAVKLLGLLDTDLSTTKLVEQALGLIDRTNRLAAFEALKKRADGLLLGKENLLAAKIEGYGGEQAVQLLALMPTSASSEVLITKTLKNIDGTLRRLAFDALKTRDLTGKEASLAALYDAYGEMEAAKLLAQMQTKDAIAAMISFLKNINGNIRTVVFDAMLLMPEKLAGFEASLGVIAANSYGEGQAVKLLCKVITSASSLQLIERGLKKTDGTQRKDAFKALSTRLGDVKLYEKKLQDLAKSTGYGKEEAIDLLALAGLSVTRS